MKKSNLLLFTLCIIIGAVSASAQTYDNMAATVQWPVGNETTATLSEGIEGAVNVTGVSVGNDLKVVKTDASYTLDGVTFGPYCNYQPATSNPGSKPADMVEYSITMKKGTTFTINNLTFDAIKEGTDNAYFSWSYTVDGTESAVKAYSDPKTQIRRNNNANPSAPVTHSESIAASPGKVVTVRFYLSNVANNKSMSIGKIKISGTINGTPEQVNQYAINAVAVPQEGGTASISPTADKYDAGTTLTLTATKTFGYQFENWTNAAGTVVSTEPVFVTQATSDDTFTANFRRVNTYSLNVNIDGAANDYMISYNPMYQEVNGKKMYEEGTKVTITAGSNDILTFTSWSDGQTASEIVYTMDRDVDLTASYSAVDFIAGWDFITPGNSSRVADFAAEGNDADALVMRDAEGNLYTWLDKSQQAAGGYEGRPGAVCWINSVPVGTCYWQTKVNAVAFTDLKVKCAMVYNYNAYQNYNLEYSLDGTKWTTIGTVSMPATKSWTDLEAAVPADANNQSEVYFRWIADKNSAIDGTSSTNDGACLGAVFITGTSKIIDDGMAPKLLYTVPADDATEIASNGKIILTFDENIKLTDKARAMLDGNNVTPTASGKTVIVEYKGLAYSTNYGFVLSSGSVSDLSGNVLNEDISITFKTKDRPAIAKRLYDFVVPRDGSLADAIAAANAKGTKNTERFRVFIMDGKYVLPLSAEKKTWTVTLADKTTTQTFTGQSPITELTGSCISIIGADYNTVEITNEADKLGYFQGQYGTTGVCEGIGNSDVIRNKGNNNYFQGITIKNPLGDARGRDIAFDDEGDKTIFMNARLWAYQDTYVSHVPNRYYFEGGVIRGRTDYMCGKGDVYYKEVTLQTVPGGYIAVPSQPKKYGYIYDNCIIKLESKGSYTLGRPWGQGTPVALFINTKMESAPTAEGWSEMSGGYPARFAEYNSQLMSGTKVDLSGRKTTFGGQTNCNNPVLTAAEAAEYTISKVMGQDDGWDPTYYTEQANAPENVELAGFKLSWTDSDYALLYAVCKNGKVVAFTTDPYYTVDDETATWSVRAANEMGGLGEPAVAVKSTDGIKEITAANTTNSNIYNIAGQRFRAPAKGIMIQNEKKFVK